MKSKFEIETQQEVNWCWAAVATTVSRYFFPHQALRQCDIAHKVVGTECCNHPDSSACNDIKTLDEALGAVDTPAGKPLKYQPSAGPLSFEEIRKQIDSRRPVCAEIQWFDEGAHFVMISGYSISQSKEPWVDISDPYYEDSTIPYEEFVFAYLDAGNWARTYLVDQS